MRPGIILRHASEVSQDSGILRSDVTGFIAVVPKPRWPKDVVPGDFIEMTLGSANELATSPGRVLFDPVTRQAILKFFQNGGTRCRLFGLVIESEHDLMVEDPFAALFTPLLDHLSGEEDLGLLAMPVLSHIPVEFQNKKPIVRCEPVWEILLKHCQKMNNRFLLIDPPRDLHGEQLTQWVQSFQKRVKTANSFGAIYYPWLMDGDETFPPSGCVAGVYARLEQEHAPFGVRWPPANYVLNGVTQPVVDLRWSETGTFSDHAINPILTQATRGVVIWGAKTLSTDPKYTFINSRRIVSFISEQLRRDGEWATFETQDPSLWRTMGLMVAGRLDQLWSAGLLAGEVAGAEYSVKCDEEVNTTKDRNAGIVNVVVSLRPISTAERIVIELRLGASNQSTE